MKMHRYAPCRVVQVALVVLLTTATASYALPADQDQPNSVEIAQAADNTPHELEPRYQPVPPEQPSWYNSSYIFGTTRGVADSTMVPAVKGLLFLVTIPVDLVLLPIAAIGGLFG